MFDRKQNIEKIRQKFSEFDVFIQSSNKSGYFDINRYAEDVSKEILNTVYGYNLVNLNFTEGLNFPVIDLADEAQGICFQVTANKSSSDFKTIVSRFQSKKLNEKYPKLCILILSCNSDQTKIKKAIELTHLPSEQVLDFNKIINHIESLGSQGDNIIDTVLAVLDANHIRASYFETALDNYKTANKKRFTASSLSYTEPYLIKELSIRQEAFDEWENDHLSKVLIQREHGKVTLHKILNEVKQFVITGNPGSGKSEMVKHIFNSLINNGKYCDAPLVPIYLSLSDKVLPEKIENLISAELNKYIPNNQSLSSEKITEGLMKLLLKSGSLCLILDGYDELDIKHLKEWNEFLRVFLVHYSNARLLITVRKNRITNDIHLPIQNVYDILPFDDSQLVDYVKKTSKGLNINDATVNEILMQLRDSKLNYTEPALIIRMLVNTALSTTKYNFSQSKGLIYKQYFEFVINKKLCDIGIKDPKTSLGNAYKGLLKESFRVLSLISADNFLNKKRNWEADISCDALNNILDRVETKNSNSYLFAKGVAFFEKELHLIKTYNNLISFNHFTYQEFFFSYWLKERLLIKSSNALRWIKSAYSISKYNQVFIFFMGLLSQTEAELFVKEFLKWPLRQRFALAKIMEASTDSKYLFLGEVSSEALLTEKTRNLIIEKAETHIEVREPLLFQKSCRILSSLKPGSEDLFNKILKSLKSYTHWQRREGLYNYTLVSIRHNNSLIASMKKLLSHKDSYVRGTAINFFTKAEIFDSDITERAIELYFIKDAHNFVDVQRYIVALSKFKPDACRSFIEKWKAQKEPNLKKDEAELFVRFISYYAGAVLNISDYKAPEYEDKILEVLADGNPDKKNKVNLIRSLAKSNIRNQAIQNRLFEILESDEEMAFASLMYYRDLFIIKPEIIEKAISYIDSNYADTRIRAINYLADIQYSGEINYNARRVLLAEVIEEKLYNDHEDPNSSFRSYSVQYLAGVNYKNEKLENFLLEKALNEDPDQVFTDREVMMRYFVAVNHFSGKFLGLIMHYQKIRDVMTMSSGVSDNYFEHIERYVPEKYISMVKGYLYKFCFVNIKAFIRLINIFKNTSNSDLWANEQVERFMRTGLALQKIILYEDERKQFRLLN